MKKRIFPNLVLFLASLGLIFFTLGLSGCGGGSTEADGLVPESGDIVIGLTDATGDFTSYTVDILSLKLTKKNGAEIETLPLSTRVDFAQYTEMTEFLTAATVPSGVYTKAVLRLDYQNADIWVENEDGDAKKVDVDAIKDEDGNPITTFEVSVHLKDANSVLIAPGIPVHLTLDFDLAASNTVDFDEDGSPKLLTVAPVLLADVDPQTPKIHRLRGMLKDVSVEDGSFDVIIRPFYHIFNVGRGHFGTLAVQTTDDTLYDIDGQQYQGQEGLEALDQMTTLSAVVVIGDLKFRPCRFEASEVRAGSSVPGGTMDVVRGNVISRDGDTLIIRGASLIRSGGSVIFNDRVTVLVGEDTVVKRQLSTDTFDIGDISVGQRIRVFGTLTNTDRTQLELDATAGQVRMLLTTLRGMVVGTVSGAEVTAPLVIDLQSIDRRRIGIFDFEGTGEDTDHDADPENYEIYTGNLDISSFAHNTPVKVRGIVTPFGQASPDFDARTVVDFSNVKSFMNIHWHPASTDPFEELSTERITINLDGVGHFHRVGRDHMVVDLKDLSQPPIIRPTDEGEGLFWITWPGMAQLYTSFDDFVDHLADRMAHDFAVKKIFATGLFDGTTATLTTEFVVVKLK